MYDLKNPFNTGNTNRNTRYLLANEHPVVVGLLECRKTRSSSSRKEKDLNNAMKEQGSKMKKKLVRSGTDKN